MFVYITLFIFAAYFAVFKRLQYSLSDIDQKWSLRWKFTFLLLTIVIGFRHEVGGDWASYNRSIEYAASQSFTDHIKNIEIGFSILNWLSANLSLDVYFINTFFSIFFSWGLITFCRNQPQPWLALTVAIPYLVTVVAMGYSRQGFAIGLVMLSLVSLEKKLILKFIFLIGIATMFHKSAILILSLALLIKAKNFLSSIIFISLCISFFYVLIIQETFEGFITGYIHTKYDSSGATIRVLMNAVPACFFLIFRNRFNLSSEQSNFWTWMSVSAIGFIILLLIVPSSTAVDRLALYWIPLQLFVFSRLPVVFSVSARSNLFIVLIIVFYSAFVYFIWLNFATNAHLWIPYKFYLWKLLWN